jgi:hypothetical protein
VVFPFGLGLSGLGGWILRGSIARAKVKVIDFRTQPWNLLSHFCHVFLVKSWSQIRVKRKGEEGSTSLVQEMANNFVVIFNPSQLIRW